MIKTNYKKGILNISMFLFVFLIFGQTHASFYFSTNLSYGISSPDVIELQKILNQDERTRVAIEGAGSIGNETAYFGAKTRDAVIRFQEIYRNEILAPGGLLSPTGYVGMMTKAKLNSLMLSNPNTSILPLAITPAIPSTPNTQSRENRPIISSVAPQNFNDGDTIVIKGSGFKPQNRISFAFAPNDEILANSVDGETISVTVITTLGESVRKILEDTKSKSSDVYKIVFESIQKNFSSEGKDGIYLNTYLVVKNSQGNSNQIPVSVRIFSIK